MNKHKRQKLVKNKKSKSQLAIATASNQESDRPYPQIFKLDVDCVQEIFDYLSIVDIYSVSQTCRRMQQITGNYFEANFANLKIYWVNGNKFGLLLPYNNRRELDVNGFKEFIQYLMIGSQNYQTLVSHCCKSLKRIRFDTNDLFGNDEYLKPLLSEIETIELTHRSSISKYLKTFLQFCPKLKQLAIYNHIQNYDYSQQHCANDEWLLQSYPTLQHLKIFNYSVNYYSRNIPKLGMFFDRNPNLHTLTINIEILYQNLDTMLQAKLQLQVLAVNCGSASDYNTYNQLKALHAQGFYKRLHLGLGEQKLLHRPASLDGLELLEFSGVYDPISLTINKFPHIKYLILGSSYCLGTNYHSATVNIPTDFELIAKSCPNLEHILFVRIKSETIKTFIQYSANLKTIACRYLEGTLNLSSLNEKCGKKLGARKITIYLDENGYLSTKWSNKSTDLKFITIRRIESYTKPLSMYDLS